MNRKNAFASRIAEELSKPINPLALKIGCELGGDDDLRYLICGVVGYAFVLCRIPVGMGALDLGRRFRHAPTPDDPAHCELLDGCFSR